MTGHSSSTVVQWYSYLRDTCSHYFVNNDYKIGGIGHRVELDESVISRRKYHQGRMVRERWIFWGKDLTTGLGFLRFVEDKTANTLLPIVQELVAPGTEIITDKWPSYIGIPNIPVDPPYIHLTVNHSDHFVDPITGVTTNHIERMWCEVKYCFKQMNETTDDMI